MPIESQTTAPAIVNGNMKQYTDPEIESGAFYESDDDNEIALVDTEAEYAPEQTDETENDSANDNRGKATTIDIDHEFTEDELSDLAVNITSIDKKIDELESEMEGYKRSANRLKKEIEEVDNERRDLSRKYRKGKEIRTLSVRQIENYQDGLIEYYEIPSGMLVHTVVISDGGMFDKSKQLEGNEDEIDEEIENSDEPDEVEEEIPELEEVEN
ncbi:MAG: hypothetical protein M9949_04995 [Candidatus Kapabacteria bacterium]|nr:hypothetical protein [Candidatus Kapabacteria bacterium]